MKIDNRRKIFKLVTLFLTSIMIATVSAATYKYMYIDGSVSIATNQGLKWIEGSDAPTDTTITGSTVTLPLSVYNGTPVNFTYCLYIQNLDNASHSIQIDVTNDATSSLYDEFNLMIFNNSTGAYITTLNVLTTSTYSGTIGNLAVWRLTFEVAAKATASGNDNFGVQFRYE